MKIIAGLVALIFIGAGLWFYMNELRDAREMDDDPEDWE